MQGRGWKHKSAEGEAELWHRPTKPQPTGRGSGAGMLCPTVPSLVALHVGTDLGHTVLTR